MLILSEERKFHLIFAQGSKKSREREFQGTKVPGSESSVYGTFAPGSESTGNKSSCYQQQQLEFVQTVDCIPLNSFAFGGHLCLPKCASAHYQNCSFFCVIAVVCACDRS